MGASLYFGGYLSRRMGNGRVLPQVCHCVLQLFAAYTISETAMMTAPFTIGLVSVATIAAALFETLLRRRAVSA